MKRNLLSYLWMIGIVTGELLLVAGLFLFSTRSQVIFVVVSSLVFIGLLLFLLFRRIKEQSNLKPTSEVVGHYIDILKMVGLIVTVFTFLVALIKAVILLIGRF